jgi:membrane complex biogenesis BtpA family protein
MQSIIDRAILDALAIEQGGADGLIIENFGDAPFYPETVGPETTAAMTLTVHEIRQQVQVPIGINVLRNDAIAALAIATVLGCDFIRVNVHTGVVATDQGLIQGRACDTLRYRDALKSNVMIFADVFVKHGKQLDQENIADAAKDVVHRGLADAVIVTGQSTGSETARSDLKKVKTAIPETPVLAGSGISVENIEETLTVCDGLIVGTGIKIDGQVYNPVDVNRVKIITETRNRISNTA